MCFRCQTDSELTLLLHVVGSSSPLRWAQKTVKSTIDGTLKSYVLICVRWYSLINILSRAHRISHSLCFPLFDSFSANRSAFICDCVAYCAFGCLCVCVSVKKRRTARDRKYTEPMCEIDSPGICAYLVDSLHSSDNSDCTWERTLGRIWNRE